MWKLVFTHNPYIITNIGFFLNKSILQNTIGVYYLCKISALLLLSSCSFQPLPPSIYAIYFLSHPIDSLSAVPTHSPRGRHFFTTALKQASNISLLFSPFSFPSRHRPRYNSSLFCPFALKLLFSSIITFKIFFCF